MNLRDMHFIRSIREKNKKLSGFCALAAVELLFLVFSLLQYLRPLHEYCYQGGELTGSFCTYRSVSDQFGEGCYLELSQVTDPSVDPKYLYITTPSVDLPAGSYRVSVVYATDNADQKYAATSRYRTYSVVAGHDGNRLPMKDNRMDFVFFSPVKVDDYEVHINYSGAGYLFVESISIYETSAWKNCLLFYVILFSLFADGFLFFYRKLPEASRREARILLAAVIGLTVFASLPAMSFFQQQGDDLPFHLNRIEAIKESILNGQLPNRVSLFWNAGYGYASAVFYGEAFLYLPALLRILGFTVQGAYKFYVVMVNLATILVSYYCLNKVLRHKYAAMFGAAVYVLAPYRLACVHMRAAVGEYTAMAFFPLIFYGLYCICAQETGDGRKAKGWLPLLFGFTGLIQCHVISCLVAGGFTCIFCLVFIKKMFQPARLWQLVKAGIGTALLNLWFLLPFMDYMRLGYTNSSDISVTLGRMNSHGAFLSQMLTVFQEGFAPAYTILEGADQTGERNYALGIAVFAAFLYLICRLYWGGKRTNTMRIGDWSLVFGAAAAWMCTIWFPWDGIQQMNGLFRMITRNIQFPWRFMGICSFFFSVTAACLVRMLHEKAGRPVYVATMAVLGCVAVFSADYTMYTYVREAPLHRYVSERELDSCFVGAGEYLLEGTPADYMENTEAIAGTGVKVREEQRKDGIYTVSCSNADHTDSYLDLPIFPYRGYVCRDQSTGEKMEVQSGEPYRLRVVIPEGYSGTLCVRYEEPWYWRMAELVSLLTLAAWAAVTVVRGKRNKSQRRKMIS